MLVDEFGLLVARLSVVLELELVQLPLVIKFYSLCNLFLHIFQHYTALNCYFTQLLLRADLKLVFFVCKSLVEALHQYLLVLIVLDGVLMFECLELCLLQLDLFHVVLLNLLQPLFLLFSHLALVVFNVLM